jgi:LysM repeat protein
MLVITLALIPTSNTIAHDNLLQNPGFNNASQYVDQRPNGTQYSFAFAPGWGGWQTRSPSTASWMNAEPIAYPHTGNYKYEGNAAQNIGRGSATITVAAYQTVNNVAEGTTLKFDVWVFQDNSSSADPRTRVGIGSNVNNNPLAADITWSDWMRAVRSWQNVEVTATVPAGNVTVFIYSTQSQPNDPNKLYYDDAELKAVGQGTPNVGSNNENATPRPTSTPRPVFAAFVNPQGADDAGRIEHVVQSGDTLAAIAVAYGVPLSEILELNNLPRGAVLQIGQTILVKEASDEPVPEAEATEAADDSSSEDAFGTPTPEVADSASAGFASPTPQEVAVNPTSSEPTEPPTATPVPPTPTDAPPAPVNEGANADPLALDTAVCVLMFNDSNQNNIRDANEGLLGSGIITLRAENSSAVQEYVTTGETEPYCYLDLEPGDYNVSAIAPDGYGLPARPPPSKPDGHLAGQDAARHRAASLLCGRYLGNDGLLDGRASPQTEPCCRVGLHRTADRCGNHTCSRSRAAPAERPCKPLEGIASVDRRSRRLCPGVS